jgi:hypothetical protein
MKKFSGWRRQATMFGWITKSERRALAWQAIKALADREAARMAAQDRKDNKMNKLRFQINSAADIDRAAAEAKRHLVANQHQQEVIEMSSQRQDFNEEAKDLEALRKRVRAYAEKKNAIFNKGRGHDHADESASNDSLEANFSAGVDPAKDEARMKATVRRYAAKRNQQIERRRREVAEGRYTFS